MIFTGAKFDANGFCVAHPDTRLCSITEDGKFKVVRKTCRKCGTAALMTDPRNVKTNVHGYKHKPSKHREIKGLMTCSESQVAHRRTQSHKEIDPESKPTRGRSNSIIPCDAKCLRSSIKCAGDEAKVKDEASYSNYERHSKRDLRHQTSEKSKRFNDNCEAKASGLDLAEGRMGGELNEAGGHKSARRSRTLSPSRKLVGMRSRTLSPSRKLEHPASPVKKGHPSTNSKGWYFKKVSEELSPAHVKKVISTKFLSKRSTGKAVPVVEESKIDENKNRFCVPFNKKGYCHMHSDVQLAKVDKKGHWVVMLDVCPQCNETSKPLRTRAESLERNSGKVKRALKQLKNPEMNDEAENSIAIYSEKVKEAKAAAALTDATTETALVLAEPAGTKYARKDSKVTGIFRKSSSIKSMQSLTSATTNSPESFGSISPAFSSAYFTGGTTGFPALPQEMN